MATFFIEQFGCRATQADAAAIERQLRERGYVASTNADSADVVVVNTCTVTAAADTQARQAIHMIHQKNRAARIVVTGCYAQRAPEELTALGGVAWVVGNSHKPEIPRLIEEMAPISQRPEEGFVPLATIARGEPLATIARGEPLATIARGEPLATIARGEPLATIARGEPLATIARGEPLATIARGEPLATIARGEPLATIARGEPLATIARGEPLATIARGEPLATIARGEPLATIARGEPLATIARGEPLATVTPGESFSLECGVAKVLTGNILEQREFFFAPVEGGEAGHTRSVLKIQDGCDSRCSYCVIPQVRGRSRSLAPDRVIQEIRALSERGAREIVLSGIDLGNYGRDLDPRTALDELLRRVLDETSIEQLRVSSIEPMDVTEDLIALFAATSRLAPHFHMPMQSGSDRVLAAMRRWYRAEHYARRAEMVREYLPDTAIGADVIAGFPGETEEDHSATLSFIKRMPLTYLHVFSFSPRPGTAAAEMDNHVAPAMIAARAQELRAVGESKKAAFRAAQAGRIMRVLTLNRMGNGASGPWTRALSGNYLDVRVAGVWPSNQFLSIQATGLKDGHLWGVAF